MDQPLRSGSKKKYNFPFLYKEREFFPLDKNDVPSLCICPLWAAHRELDLLHLGLLHPTGGSWLPPMSWQWSRKSSCLISRPFPPTLPLPPADHRAPCRPQLQPLHRGHAAAPRPVRGGAGGELRRGRGPGRAAHHRDPLHEGPDQTGRSHPGEEVRPKTPIQWSCIFWTQFYLCVYIYFLPQSSHF